MLPSNGGKLQAPPCSKAAIGRVAGILNRGIKFADVQRNKIHHRMAEMGQLRHFERVITTSAVHPGADISLRRHK
jgi:hypothetical protein